MQGTADHSAREQYRDLARQVKERLPLDALIGGSVKLIRKGREQIGLCPFHNEKTPSFTVVTSKGFGHCFGCGWHGDLFKFYMDRHGVDFLDALSDLAAMAGIAGAPRAAKQRTALAPPPDGKRAARTRETEEEREQRLFEHARRLWHEAAPAGGTIVETYLRAARCIDLDPIGGVPPTLRFHPELKTGKDNGNRVCPGMVAPIQDAAGRMIGLHRTFLKPDGSGKAQVDLPPPRAFAAKKTLGGVWGGAIRLCALPPDGDALAIGEGIETCLTVLVALTRAAGSGNGPALPVWCGVNLGNMAGSGAATAPRRAKFHSSKVRVDPETGEVTPLRLPTEIPDMDRPGLILPRQVKRLTHLVDGDSDPEITRALIERATRRRQAEGVTVTNVWPPRGFDFNDLAQRYRKQPAPEWAVPDAPDFACGPAKATFAAPAQAATPILAPAPGGAAAMSGGAHQ